MSSLLDDNFDINIQESIKNKVIEYLKTDQVLRRKINYNYNIIYIGLDNVTDIDKYSFYISYNDKKRTVTITFDIFSIYSPLRTKWWAVMPTINSNKLIYIRDLLENF